jgi:hypothetical protein
MRGSHTPSDARLRGASYKGFAIVNKFLLVLALVAISILPARAQAAPSSGYWWNTAAAGSGFVIEVQGNQMFMAGFLYAANGEATWVASFGPMNSPTQYSGPLVTFSGGQTLTGNYQSPTQNANPVGNIAISFTDNTHASVTWPGGTIPIQRLDFGAGGASAPEPATNPETGWWLNTSEGGRGFAVEVQNGSMYLAGYMYDPAGNPVWYLANGPMASATLYQGEWTQFGNGQTLTGSYQAPITANSAVGTVTLQFNSAYSATLTLPNARQIPLIRYGFGVSAPVLTAFSPAGAEPESLFTISGTGFDPSGTVTLTLSDNTGYSVNVPAASVSSTTVKVAVPPYIVASSGAFGTGTVNLQAVQKSNGVSLTTNSLSGFAIQALPSVAGTPGQSTLALIRANLAEAQKLQISVNGTAQGTPAVEAALAAQVTNLQTLATNIQSVVQNGVSFSLGAIGGVNITVTPTNISDVDSLILATLQALANPPAGSLKTAQTSSPDCLAAEASAFEAAMTSGSGNLQQLAQNLLEAPDTSAACNSATAFGSAYQIFGGAGDVGLGIANGAGGGLVGNRLPGAALFTATTQNANSAIGINALISPNLATQVASVQSTIAQVQALADPTVNVLVAKSPGTLLASSITTAQTVTDAVAPPPVTGAATINGTVSGGGAVAMAAITITDSTGKTVAATAAADGSYSASVTGLTAPISVIATDPAGLTGPMLSVASSLPTSNSAVVNVTPITTAVAAMLVANGNPYAISRTSLAKLATPVALANAVSILNQALAPILTANGQSVSSFSPISTGFIANDTGPDAIAGAVNLLPYGAGYELVATANPAQTFVLGSSAVAPSTPLSAPPVTSNYLDFMQAELQKCLAVAIPSRAADPTCSGITDPNFLANGYTTLSTAVTDFGLGTSVGATVALPKTLVFLTDTAGDQTAIVRFKYTLVDGTLGRMVVVMRQVPTGTTPVTLPDGKIANWTFYGNQGNYYAYINSRADRRTFLDGTTSYYDFGLDLGFDPSGPNAANVNSVQVTGPGLPGGGIWIFRSSVCGTSTYMTISSSFHAGPPATGQASTTTSNTTVFRWSWAPIVSGTNFTPPTNQQWAASPVDSTTIPFASQYTFKLYDVGGQLITSFTRRNVSPAIDATYVASSEWPTLSPATAAAFLSPTGPLAAAQTSVMIGWTNPPLGLPALEIHVGSGGSVASVDGFGPPAGTTTSATVTAGVSNNGSITSLCTGSQFSAFATGVYRFIQIQSRDPSDVQVFDQNQYTD